MVTRNKVVGAYGRVTEVLLELSRSRAGPPVSMLQSDEQATICVCVFCVCVCVCVCVLCVCVCVCA